MDMGQLRPDVRRLEGRAAGHRTFTQIGFRLQHRRGIQAGYTLYKPNGGLCTGLEARLRNGIRLNKYAYSDPDTHARTMARQRLTALSTVHPQHFPPEAGQDDFKTISGDAADVTSKD